MANAKRIKLRAGFAKEILHYLMLEYGESPEDPTALKLSDLKYVGEHLHRGVLTHFWSYPYGRRKSWAIVQPYGKSYLISTCTTAPGSDPDTSAGDSDDSREDPEDRRIQGLLSVADKWKKSQLKLLRKRPVAELWKLPERTKLEPPAKLREFSFAVLREPREKGGARISVQIVFDEGDGLESRWGPYFEILPNGRVVDP